MNGLVDIILEDGTHLYYSTHCRHGRHKDCEATEVVPGVPRKPAQCKTCEASCICTCHKNRRDSRVSNFPEWATFAGMASKLAFSTEERLTCAMRALELLEAEHNKTREQSATTIYMVIGMDNEAPQDWKDLVEAFTLMSKGAATSGPTHCEHDELTVCADAHVFTKDELARLYELGFFVENHEEEGEGSAADCKREYCDASFKSFRFGSA